MMVVLFHGTRIVDSGHPRASNRVINCRIRPDQACQNLPNRIHVFYSRTV